MPFLPAALTILFVALKLCHVITWSWLWVLAPTWIGLVIWLVVVLAIIAWAFVAAAADRRRWRRS